MIDEIYVIQEDGLPLYYYRGKTSLLNEDFYTLQSGLFTALLQFGAQLGEGELRLISFEEKTYALQGNKSLLLIFGVKNKLNEIDLSAIEQQLISASNHITELVPESDISPSYVMKKSQMDDFVDSFGGFLVRQKIIEQEEVKKAGDFKNQLQSLVLKSIGYQPGVCNIGKTERLKRLKNGFLTFIVTLILYFVIVFFALPNWLVFLLFLPLMMGFMHVYQYLFRFCVKNALTRKYNMS